MNALLVAGMNQNNLSIKYTLAANLAQDLLDEIIARPFYDPDTPDDMTPGPELGESSRPLFDNADDYHGLSEQAGHTPRH